MWDLSGPGIEPTSAGGVPTTGPPGKFQNDFFLKEKSSRTTHPSRQENKQIKKQPLPHIQQQQ